MTEIDEQRVEQFALPGGFTADLMTSGGYAIHSPDGNRLWAGNMEKVARFKAALADREAAERVAGSDLWTRYEALRRDLWNVATFREAEAPLEERHIVVAALDAFVRRHIALAEAGGAVPAAGPNDRIDPRTHSDLGDPDAPYLDEVVISNATVHIEQMTDEAYWMGVYRGDEMWHFWIQARDGGKIDLTCTEQPDPAAPRPPAVGTEP